MTPQNKEKHFLVTEVEFDEQGNVVACLIEAVMSKREAYIQWQDLKDRANWSFGWK